MNDPLRWPSSPGDWTEDFTHENGQYECKCTTCFGRFTGRKRRVTCRVCAGEAVALKARQEANLALLNEPYSPRLNGEPVAVSYDLLERAHKQEGWTTDQQRHYELGWEARNYDPDRADAVFSYLLGEGRLEGVAFGDGPPLGERGRFWWRKALRKALQGPKKPPETDEPVRWKVKPWDSYTAEMAPQEDGDWVGYEEYEALARLAGITIRKPK